MRSHLLGALLLVALGAACGGQTEEEHPGASSGGGNSSGAVSSSGSGASSAGSFTTVSIVSNGSTRTIITPVGSGNSGDAGAETGSSSHCENPSSGCVLCGDDTWICAEYGGPVRYDVCDPVIAEKVTHCTTGGCFLCNADGEGEVWLCKGVPKVTGLAWGPTGTEYECRP